MILPVKAKGKEINVTFEIVDLMQENSFSGDIAEQLNLLQIINTVKENAVHEELSRDFPDLIKTAGTLPEEYSIKIDENAKGVIHPVRRLAASVKPRAICRAVKNPHQLQTSLIV